MQNQRSELSVREKRDKKTKKHQTSKIFRRHFKIQNLNDKLLTIINAPWFQDSNAIVFQESSVQLSQKKIAGMFQTKMQIYSWTILQDTPRQVQEKDCQSVPQDLALLFQNSNVPMSLDRYQGKSVKLFKDNNVKMFQDNNAAELQKNLFKLLKFLQNLQDSF